MKDFTFSLLTIYILLNSVSTQAEIPLASSISNEPDMKYLGNVKLEQQYDDYIFHAYCNAGNDASYVMFKKDEPVDWKIGMGICHQPWADFPFCTIGLPDESGLASQNKIADITKDGTPEMVISYYTGGSHCCYNYIVYALGERLVKYLELDAADSRMEFKDINEDGIYEILGRDATFVYWLSSYADSQAPSIILHFVDSDYHLDFKHMSAPVYDEDVLFNTAKELESQFRKLPPSSKTTNNLDRLEIPSRLWGTMLDLIYSCNSEIAWKFLDWAWPKEIKGKQEFQEEFLKQLKTSPYWPDLEKVITLPSEE